MARKSTRSSCVMVFMHFTWNIGRCPSWCHAGVCECCHLLVHVRSKQRRKTPPSTVAITDSVLYDAFYETTQNKHPEIHHTAFTIQSWPTHRPFLRCYCTSTKMYLFPACPTWCWVHTETEWVKGTEPCRRRHVLGILDAEGIVFAFEKYHKLSAYIIIILSRIRR